MHSVRKLAVVLVLVVVSVAACGGSEKPVQDLDVGLPGIVQGDGDAVAQCKATLISGDAKTPRYRNTYFALGMDGTETIQSVVEGPTPCP